MKRAVAIGLSLLLACGCATTVPYTGVGPYPQLERGAPVAPVDFIGNVLSLPFKLLLWSWRFNLHSISPQTEETLIAYLEKEDLPAFEDTKFRLNQYRPVQDLARLVKNRHVAWPYRLLLGFPLTLVFDVLLPGRLFPWGDYYNPYTNTVHLYSDHPAVALHEAGHAHDFSEHRYKGSYAVLRLVPGVDLFQEYTASSKAIDYFIMTQDRLEELRAYRILYPAYGTYLGSYLLPYGAFPGALVGHIWGRLKAHTRAGYYQLRDAADASPGTSVAPP